MKISRLRLRTSSLVTALVCTAWLSACGDGDGTQEPTGGTAGSGAAGASGKGGSAGTTGGGKGGSAGSSGSGAGESGSAGTGGTAEGGEGGIGGTGATGGEGASGAQGATGGEGAVGGEGAAGGEGAVAGEGGTGGVAGEGAAGGEGGIAGTAGGSVGGEGGAPIGGSGGEGAAPVCELTECGAECVDLDVGRVSGQTVADCGACFRDCSLNGATSATCATGLCDPTCAEGRADCEVDDGNGEDDGCESDLTAPITCGACDHACSTANTSATACDEGACTPTCTPGFLDCTTDDGNGEDDGCETAITTAASCGTTCENVVACEADHVCQVGVCEPSGLAVLTIPFTAADQMQRYAVTHASSMVDLTNDIVNVRLYAPGATAGSINIYLLDFSGPTGGPNVTRDLTTLNSGWVTVSIPVGAAAGDWDPSQIKQVTLDVSSGTTGPWATPTIIYVDRIWSDNGLLNDRFAASANPPMVKSSVASTSVTGSDLTWTALRP